MTFTSASVRRATITVCTSVPASASSTIFLSGMTLPPRMPSLAVSTTRQSAAQSREARHLDLAEYWYAQHLATWGQQPRGIFGADEQVRTGCVDPRQGFETCGFGEFAKSFYHLGRLTGRAQYAADQSYFNTVANLCQGLEQTVTSYEDSEDTLKRRVYAVWKGAEPPPR